MAAKMDLASKKKKNLCSRKCVGRIRWPLRGESRTSEDIPGVSRKLTWELKSGSGNEMNRFRFVFKDVMAVNGNRAT